MLQLGQALKIDTSAVNRNKSTYRDYNFTVEVTDGQLIDSKIFYMRVYARKSLSHSVVWDKSMDYKIQINETNNALNKAFITSSSLKTGSTYLETYYSSTLPTLNVSKIGNAFWVTQNIANGKLYFDLSSIPTLDRQYVDAPYAEKLWLAESTAAWFLVFPVIYINRLLNDKFSEQIIILVIG
ncbi:hypothetical protein [Aliikangiella maris]|uniref:Uncharacterized protein n=2 Tax=Aliikangiella maris TaxID=3162458 RepID=A0ABV3MLU3_9GAMM